MNFIEQIKSATLVEPLGWAILHSIWQGAAIAVLAAIALRIARSRSAQLRYLIACGALLSMLIVAGVTLSRVNAAAKRESVQLLAATNLAPTHVGSAAPIADVVDAKSPTPLPPPPFAERIRPILPNLAIAWLAGVLLLGAYHAGGWMLIRRLRGQSRAIADARCRASLADLIAAMRISRPVQLCESAIVQVPTVIGWLSPVILLPASAIVGLTPLELRGLLAHELAHIRRHDYLVNLIQTIVETLFFYHPAAWWLGKTIRQERENCCDDLAAAMCEPAVYAQALASMESLRQSPQLALSARGGALLPRIRRILGVPASSNRRAIPSGVVSAVILIAILGGGIALNACRTNAKGPTAQPEATFSQPTQDDLIALPDDGYRIKPNDSLSISISEWGDQKREMVKNSIVKEDGTIQLPLIGPVTANGRSVSDLEGDIARACDKSIGPDTNRAVTVTIGQSNGRRFSIRGYIKQPGQYALPIGDFRVLDALNLARDTTANASTIFIIRQQPGAPDGEKRVIRIPLDPLRKWPGLNVVIYPDDLINVVSDAEANDFRPTSRWVGNAASQSSQSTLHILQGRITDTATGKPVPNVTIRFYTGVATRALDGEAHTDADGRYQFRPIGTMVMEQSVTHQVWDVQVGMQIEHETLCSADGESWWDVTIPHDARTFTKDFKLVPGGKLFGTVNNKLGQGDANVPLRIYDRDNHFFVYATTDARGQFTSAPLFPGDYVIDVNSADPWYPRLATAQVRPGENSPIELRYDPPIATPTTAPTSQASVEELRRRLEIARHGIEATQSKLRDLQAQSDQPAIKQEREHLGDVLKSLQENENSLQMALHEVYPSPPAATGPASQPTSSKTADVYYISGVARTGVYSLNRPITLLQAVISAGMDESMREKTLTIIHRAGDRQQLKMGDVMDGPDGKTPVQPDDVLMIAPMSGEYYMGGHVERVGVYSLSGRTIDLLQAIISAGGDPAKIGDYRVELRRRYPTEHVVLQCTVKELVDDPAKRLTLVPNDIVTLALPKATTQPAATQPSTQASIPQAAPMIDLLTAANESDVQRFRSAFTKDVQAHMSLPQDWPEKLNEAKGSLRERFGDCSIADFKFSFAGDENAGILTTTVANKPPFNTKVVKEDGAWKLAEH